LLSFISANIFQTSSETTNFIINLLRGIMAQSSNFFSKLFDFSFSQFIALRVVGVLYGFIVILAGLATLVYIGTSLSRDFTSGIIALIVGPLFCLTYLIFIRIGLELMIVVFKIADNTSRILENSEYLKKL
jgi:Domain of unknown function (DUF4282)